MIAYSIREPGFDSSKALRIGFSVWTRSSPKNYLSIYPEAAKEVFKSTTSASLSLCALVDDVWPRVELARTRDEQEAISSCYATLLPELGFNEIHFVSEFMTETVFDACLSIATKVTLSEFWKLLPQSKKDTLDDLTLAEVIGFLWHVHVLENAISRYKLTGILAGIRSEFFYLASRKLLPAHEVYFVNTA